MALGGTTIENSDMLYCLLRVRALDSWTLLETSGVGSWKGRVPGLGQGSRLQWVTGEILNIAIDRGSFTWKVPMMVVMQGAQFCFHAAFISVQGTQLQVSCFD